MQKEVIKHFVLVNNNVVADCAGPNIAQILVEGLTNKLSNQKNIDIRYVKQTQVVEVPDPKPAEPTKPEPVKAPTEPAKEDLKKKN